MEITNLPDAVFKTLVIRMLKELTECCKNIREEIKVTLSEIKKNLQGTNSGRNEVKNEINDLEHKEEKKAFNQNNKRKKEFKKTRIM